MNDVELAREYNKCRAVIFTPFLEYGLIPREACASGTPVICYGYGGVEETMIPSNGSSGKMATAVFFYEQTSDSLAEAVKKFETISFDQQFLVDHASKWDVRSFQRKMREVVDQFCSGFEESSRFFLPNKDARNQ